MWLYNKKKKKKNKIIKNQYVLMKYLVEYNLF